MNEEKQDIAQIILEIIQNAAKKKEKALRRTKYVDCFFATVIGFFLIAFGLQLGLPSAIVVWGSPAIVVFVLYVSDQTMDWIIERSIQRKDTKSDDSNSTSDD